MDPEDAGDIGAGAAGGEHAKNLGPLPRQQLGAPPTRAALRTGRLQTSVGSLAHHRSLEFGEAAKHLHHHAPGRTGGVDCLGQGAEVGARGVDLLQDVQQVLERARQAIEFPDDERIALAHLIEEAV